MNKSYRSVWNETTETWVAAAETATGRKKKASASRVITAGLVGVVGALALASSAHAGEIINCNASGGPWSSDNGNAGAGAWTQQAGYGGCTNHSGVILSEQQGATNFQGSANAGVIIGNSGYTTQGQIVLYGPQGIYVQGPSTHTGLATFQAGADMTNTKITDLAAGTVSASSTDGVNGSQLYGLAASTASSLGGGSAVNSDGSITNPSYVVNGSTYNNVGGALTNLSGAVTNLNTTVNNITNGGGIKYFHTNSTLADSSATGTDSTAIGPAAVASAGSAIAMGSSAASTGSNAIALGTSTQAVNSGDIAIGAGASAASFPLNWWASTPRQDGSSGTAAGTHQIFSSGIAVGVGANTTNGVAIGSASTASGYASTALGPVASATGYVSVALGGASLASGERSTAVGPQSLASGDYSSALGQYSWADGTNSTALGMGSHAVNANDVALGSNSVTAAAVNTPGTTIGGTAYTFAGANAQSTVSVGSAGNERTITNVAAGQITASSTDAINGSELYATNTQVTANTTSISNLQGDVTTIQGNISTLSGDITNINGQLADTVQYDSSAHTSITLGGSGSTTAVAIHNVANGALSASSTDAVNGAQLYATNTNVSNLAGDVTTIQGNISTLSGDITNINGKLNDAVLYDSSAHDSVTLATATRKRRARPAITPPQVVRTPTQAATGRRRWVRTRRRAQATPRQSVRSRARAPPTQRRSAMAPRQRVRIRLRWARARLRRRKTPCRWVRTPCSVGSRTSAWGLTAPMQST